MSGVPLWKDSIPTQTLPPRYDQTIVLCLDNDGMWLWLQNYEDVLFADGLPDKIISLKIGLGIFEERPRETPEGLLDKPYCLSQYLDVPEVIRFQQAILANRNQRSQQKSTKLYSLGLILAALKRIGLAPPADAEPTLKTEPHELIEKYLVGYTNKEYPRSDWEAVPVKGQKYPEWRYKGKVESLLSPTQYRQYVELKFVGYFPKPSWVLQEQQTELRDATTPRGTTKNFDPRPISAAESRLVDLIPYHWKKILDTDVGNPEKFQGTFARVDQRSPEEKAKAPSSSTAPNISGGATPGKLHGELERIDCYAFRGDTRDPMAVQAAEGFFCNATRSDVEDEEAKEKAARVDAALEKAKKKHNIETLFEALLETGVLNLGQYTKSAVFGGFVSATTSIAIAKCFANNWHEYVPTALRKDADKFNSQNFCYALRCANGFVLPSDQETRELRQQIHEFANFAEQEVAVPGMIGWNEVFGFRMCRSRAAGAVLEGPVWIRKAMPDDDPRGFQNLYALLSGRAQGRHPAIEDSYGMIRGPAPPWASRLSSFPKKSDLQQPLPKPPKQ